MKMIGILVVFAGLAVGIGRAGDIACIDDSDCVALGHKYSCFLYFCHNWVDPSTKNPRCQTDWQCGDGNKCYRHWNLREVDQGVCFTESQVAPCESHSECNDGDFCCGRHCCSQDFYSQWKNFPCISDMQCRSWNTGKYCCNNNLCCDDRRSELQATTAETETIDVPDTVTNEIPDISGTLEHVNQKIRESIEAAKELAHSAEDAGSADTDHEHETANTIDVESSAGSSESNESSDDLHENSTEIEAENGESTETTEAEPFFTFGYSGDQTSGEEEKNDSGDIDDEMNSGSDITEETEGNHSSELETDTDQLIAESGEETPEAESGNEVTDVVYESEMTEAESGNEMTNAESGYEVDEAESENEEEDTESGHETADVADIVEYEEPSVFTDEDFDRNKYLDESLDTKEEVRVVELETGESDPNILTADQSGDETSAISSEVNAVENGIVEESGDDASEADEGSIEGDTEDYVEESGEAVIENREAVVEDDEAVVEDGAAVEEDGEAAEEDGEAVVEDGEAVEEDGEAADEAIEDETAAVQTSKLVTSDPSIHRLDSADLKHNHTIVQSPGNRPATARGFLNSAPTTVQCRLCIVLLILIEVLQLGRIM